MLKEVADIKKRCESVEKSAREKLSNASTAKERNIQYYTIGAVNDIKISTTLDAFAEHVRNNLGTVKTLKIGTDEANEYIRSIMGDTLTVNRSFDEDIIRVDLHVFDASFACEAVSSGKEWEAIAKIWKYHRPYEPEETADIVTAVYEKAEKIGKQQAELNIEDEELRNLHPEMIPMISLIKKNAMVERRNAKGNKS